MTSSEKCSVKWEDFQENASGSFSELLTSQDFCDVTLVCEDNQQIEAHKVVLSASSYLFKTILRNTKHNNPLLYFWDIKKRDLLVLVDFLYKGEVKVYESDLQDFLNVAKKLKVKGLGEFDKKKGPESLKDILKVEPAIHIDVAEDQSTFLDSMPVMVKQQKKVEILTNTVQEQLFVPAPLKREPQNPRKGSPREKTSPLWKYFETDMVKKSWVQCNLCPDKIKSISKRPMVAHLKMKHREEWEQIEPQIRLLAEQKYPGNSKQPIYLSKTSDLYPVAPVPMELTPFFQKTGKPRKKFSALWNHFENDLLDSTLVHCNICQAGVRRGRPGSALGNASNKAMVGHLRKHHEEEYSAVMGQIRKSGNKNKSKKQSGSDVWNYFEEDLKKPDIYLCQVGDCTYETEILLGGKVDSNKSFLKEHLYLHDYTESA